MKSIEIKIKAHDLERLKAAARHAGTTPRAVGRDAIKTAIEALESIIVEALSKTRRV